MNKLVLKPGREKSLLNRHPWVFSGAVKRRPEGVGNGELVTVVDSKGAFLARAFFNFSSQIIARVISFQEDEIDKAFFRRRIETALDLRRELARLDPTANAWRLINGEGDLLPGLCLDRYGDHLVIRFTCAGMKLRQDLILGILREMLRPESIFESADRRAGGLENMEAENRQIAGQTPELIEIVENGLRLLVDVRQGQKTGFYLDQKFNRRRVSALAGERDVLDLFCYSGSFGIGALASGAKSAVFADSSRPACALIRRHLELNRRGEAGAEVVNSNVFRYLARLEKEKRKFDLIVVDPPAFALMKKDLTRAARAYLFLNQAALRLLREGGLLAAFSCSHHVADRLFNQIVWEAALQAERSARVLFRFHHSPDHPVSVYHPEGDYLKGLLLRVD